MSRSTCDLHFRLVAGVTAVHSGARALRSDDDLPPREAGAAARAGAGAGLGGTPLGRPRRLHPPNRAVGGQLPPPALCPTAFLPAVKFAR